MLPWRTLAWRSKWAGLSHWAWFTSLYIPSNRPSFHKTGTSVEQSVQGLAELINPMFSIECVIMKTMQGVHCWMRDWFAFPHKCHSVGETLHLMLLQHYQREHEASKENSSPWQGKHLPGKRPNPSEDTASSNENKACKSRPLRDRQTQASQKPTAGPSQRNECTDSYKTIWRIEALYEHCYQHAKKEHSKYKTYLGKRVIQHIVHLWLFLVLQKWAFIFPAQRVLSWNRNTV